MAYFKIEKNKKGELQAKIQVSGKDPLTDKNKIFVKRIYNENGLTEAKFHKQVEKIAIEFEDEVAKAYGTAQILTNSQRVLSFAELMTEWQATIKADLSMNYYARAKDTGERFNAFLQQRHLDKKPISAITVRDVQMFLNSFAQQGYETKPTARLKKALPAKVNFRELDRQGIINRCVSYGMNRKGKRILVERAKAICKFYKLNFDVYFDAKPEHRQYAVETVKGHRRILRALFNEAVRYEWITKNPVCGTKVGAGNSNTSLRPIGEKEVFTFKEAREFMEHLKTIPEGDMNVRMPIEIMLLTGMRRAEVCGLRWSNVDFEKKVIHVKQNRLYLPKVGTYEKAPKTKTSERDIPMPDALVEDMTSYMRWFRIADDDFDNKLDQYYVASNIYRQPISPNSLGQQLRRLEEKWGMRQVSCHGLRHTYCSLLLSQNVPIQTVSRYMGHSDSTITLQVYSHFIPDTQGIAINALNKITD